MLTLKVENLAAPKILPPARLYTKTGGLFIDESPKVTIENLDNTSEIRFTTNGEKAHKRKLTLYYVLPD
ncbi:MAG: hypothetical protein AAGI07_08155 [Bacteroidota bacterium]